MLQSKFCFHRDRHQLNAEKTEMTLSNILFFKNHNIPLKRLFLNLLMSFLNLKWLDLHESFILVKRVSFKNRHI